MIGVCFNSCLINCSSKGVEDYEKYSLLSVKSCYIGEEGSFAFFFLIVESV